jgi:hypothetical protein
VGLNKFIVLLYSRLNSFIVNTRTMQENIKMNSLNVHSFLQEDSSFIQRVKKFPEVMKLET